MANKEIKQTIRLEGEKEYNAAIREAQRNLRTLRSELKAETAELGANATAQQKNEARAKSLKAQIAEQEKVVQTLKKALAEAKKDYGDNEDVVQKWEQKLNEARTTLANMQSGLSEAQNAMRGASDATAEGVTATKSFADALNSVASVGESVSGAIESIFTGLVSSVRDVVADLWEMVGETAAKANNWTDIAGYWNTDPENVEKWARAIEASGNSFADFETIVSRLVLGGKADKITEMLGVSEVNYKDQWDYAVAVMERISELSKSGGLPDGMWETIFGEKKATKVMDMVNDWDTIREGLTTFNADEGGYGMGEDAMETMNDLWVQITTIEQKWVALKDQLAAGLGTITADLLVNVSGSLDALNEFMNAETDEDREAALEKLRANIEEFFAKVAAAIEAGLATVNKIGTSMAKSDDPIVSAIGKLMVGITDALQWIVDNQDTVKTALEVIFGMWLTAKLAVIGGKIAKIVADIETIKAFKNWGGVTSGAGSGLSGAGEAVGASSGAAGGVPLAGVASLAAVAYLFKQGIDYRAKYGALGSEEALETAVGQDNELRQAFIDFVETQQRLEDMEMNFDRYSNEEQDTIAAEAQAASERFNAMEGSTVLRDLYNDWRMTNGLTAMDWATPEGFFRDAGNVIAESLEQTLGGSNQNGQSSHNGLTGDDVNVFRGLPGLLRQALFTQVSGMKVVMDGETVGRIVTPYVGGGLYRILTEK